MTENIGKPKEKLLHDGVSPIRVPDEEDEDKAFGMLWEYLVPPSGRAQTAQGEIIRIAGRVQHEFTGNSCINWDGDFHRMLDAFLKYLRLGNAFDEEDLKIAEVYVGLLKESGDKAFLDNQRGNGVFIDGRLPAVLCSCAMAWVKQNAEVIAPLEAEYIR